MRARRGAVLAARIPDTGTPPPPPPPPVGDTFFDDFDGASGANPSSTYWDDQAVSSGSTVSLNGASALAMVGGTLGGFADRQYIRLGLIYANFDMTVSFRFPSTGAGHNPRIGFRGSGVQTSTLAQTDGYCVYFSDIFAYWNVEEWAGGNKTEYSDSAHSVAFGANDLVFCRVSFDFNALKVKVWRNAELEPSAWDYQTFDASFASGAMWLSHAGGGDSTSDTVLWESVLINGTPLGPSDPPPTPPPNQAPTDISLSYSSIEANATAPRGVGVFSTTDPNPGDTFVYTLVSGAGSTDNALFSINGSQLRCATDVGPVGTRSIRVRSTDTYNGGGLFVEKVFTITVTPAGAWLTTKAAILAAFQGGAPDIRIGIGSYTFNTGEALRLTVPGQRVIAQPGGTVELIANGDRSQYGGQGVISIIEGADFCEVGGTDSTFILTQALDQHTYSTSQAQSGSHQIVSGIDARANDWYIHDVIVDHVAYGFQLWMGTGAYGGQRRLHRVIAKNVGYLSGEFPPSSGYGLYLQTPAVASSVTVDMEDLCFQNICRYAVHDYGTFSMDAPRVITGILVCDTGSTVATGSSQTPTCVYFAKAEDIEVHGGHFYMSGVNMVSTNIAANKVGYGSGFYPERFVATDSWFTNSAAIAGQALTDSSRWADNGSGDSNPGWPVFSIGTVHLWARPADQAAFTGIHPLGTTWSVCYGTVPGGYEQVPGSIAYPAVSGMPSVTLVRAV